MEVNEVNATHDDEWCLGNYYLPNSNRLQNEARSVSYSFGLILGGALVILYLHKIKF
jgi:hypothetical protein